MSMRISCYMMSKILAFFTVFALMSCAKYKIDDPKLCAGYVAANTSNYVLPINVNYTIRVRETNCTSNTHSGHWRYSYDFEMFENSGVYAARAGTVVAVKEDVADGDALNLNYIYIRHADSTVARYKRMKKDGVTPVVGDVVTQGQALGTSGNTDRAPTAFLHFDVVENQQSDQTVAVNFRNIGTSRAEALAPDTVYRAETFTPNAN